ncbi:OmpA/MotB domain protein [Candidatus Vecturithrix granuli]|uniref:OmpA/MotB domain protein n=1 Tax=Vecturithrix granuli TaxID=1499967 RepID=A0A081BYF8_VECG1|nr:OmpA/MotB domain protein [Candidatus Vecturithrix granuli]
MHVSRIQPIFLMVIMSILLLTLAFPAIAQQVPATDLRESPRDDTTQKVTPVSQTTINIEVWLNKQCSAAFYPGEKAVIYFRTDADGYATLYDIDTQGKVLVIFPNRETPDNFVKAGQIYEIPAQQADYDLIVEGPEGIEYIEAVASTDAYYRWNHNEGEPRWLQDWGLKGRKLEAGSSQPQETMTAYKQSPEYQNLPKDMGMAGLQSLSHNLQLSQILREQIQSKLIVRPRETEQSTRTPQTGTTQPEGKVQPVSQQPLRNYSTATCYMYIVDQAPVSAPAPQPTQPLASNIPSGEEYLRQQEREFQQIPSVNLQRQGERLIVELPGRVLFDSGSSFLRSESRQDLSQVADVLLRYPDTQIMVMGHTDSIGNEQTNQRLSEARAKSVADFLIFQGVTPARINWIGYGEVMPIASNSTEAGRQRNRRVELEIRYAQ